MSSLLQFTVSNYRSFKTPVSFSMSASSIKDKPTGSVFECQHKQLLTTAAVYGANSSGKSNLARAIRTMRNIVVNNVRLNDGDLLVDYDPFVLDRNGLGSAGKFEIVVYIETLGRVRYGFEYNLWSIVSEWLYILPDSKKEEYCCFTRREDEIWLDEEKYPEGIDKEENTNDNRLFLSVVAQLGGPVSKRIVFFFQNELTVISGLDSKDYRSLTRESFRNQDEISKKALEFFRHIKLGFEDIEVREPSNIEEEDELHKRRIPSWLRWQVLTRHSLYDDSGEKFGTVQLNIDSHESDGTRKIFEMSASLFGKLVNGGVLVIDELDAKMHPLISQEIIKLFSDRENNPRHAQLIFTTHDTNLLSGGLLRRDEIWLTEKRPDEGTDLYRLMDVQFADGSRPRNDANLERNYIRGRYGAIPFITYTGKTNGEEK